MNGSGANLAIPVIAGLAAGIGVIVLFSMAAKPSFSMSDDEISSKVAQLPEVKALHERYQPTESFSRDGNTRYVQFAVERTWNLGNDPTCNCDDVTKQLLLTVKVDSFGKSNMQLECLGPISGGEAATVNNVRTTDCIEHP